MVIERQSNYNILERPFVERFALCYRSVVLSVCPVCLSACDVGVLWPKMKLGMRVGLGPGHIVLDGAQLPLPRRDTAPPIFGPYPLRPNGCVDQDATWYGGRSRPRPLCVKWGSRSPSPKKGTEPPSKFSAPVYCGQTAGWTTTALGTEIGLGPATL